MNLKSFLWNCKTKKRVKLKQSFSLYDMASVKKLFVLGLHIVRITFLGNLFNLHNWTLVSVCSQEARDGEDRKKKLLLFLTNFQAWPRLLLPAQQPTTNTSFLEYLCYMCSEPMGFSVQNVEYVVCLPSCSTLLFSSHINYVWFKKGFLQKISGFV